MTANTLERFLDEQGRIIAWPARKHTARRIAMLDYLAGAFDWERSYSEKEVNLLLDSRHAFGDPAYLRRALVETGRMQRNLDGTDYRRVG